MNKRTEEFLRGRTYFIHQNLLGVLRGNVDAMLAGSTNRGRAVEYRNIRQVLLGLRLIPRDAGKVLGLAFGVRPYGDRGLFVFCGEVEQMQAAMPESDMCLGSQSEEPHFICTLPKGHEGRHVAKDPAGQELASWPEPKRELLFKFDDFKEGERFVHEGKTYTKTGTFAAQDESGNSSLFELNAKVLPAKPVTES
jgi:hypothetical protein